jgi:dolichyl-phosphate-mannose--protein O-mannosyl transferase
VSKKKSGQQPKRRRESPERLLRSAALHAPLESEFPLRQASFRDSVFLFFASLAFFLLNIQYPKTKNFDEFHYIPSAQQWIQFAENQNWEHPPFAKILISLGVRLFGDEPLGWRFMSVVFGALTLVGMYRIAYHLFGSSRKAGWVCAALTLFNQLLYVQARIAMLDTFMMAFLAWSLWFFVKAIEPEAFHPKWIQSSGVFMGLAIACKWFALVPWAMCGLLLLIQCVRMGSKNRFLDLVLYWGIVPALVYFATFVPYLWVHRDPPYTLWELVTSFQARMLDGQKRVVNSHPYMSQFWDWIAMRRPIWYAFDKEGKNQDTVRGVLLLGNPFLMWGGLVAIGALVLETLAKRSLRAFLITYFYFGFAFCWILIPRKVAFYYYYYPAGMMFSLAFTYWIMKSKKDWPVYLTVGITLGFFYYFFPILAALPIPANGFTKWMWFPTWI